MNREPFAEIAALVEVEERDTLMQAARRDPVRGAPAIGLRDRYGVELEMIEPGEWRGMGLSDAITGLPPACPVVPLGSQDKTFYFLNTLGQVHELEAASSGKGPIDALFQGRGGYLEWAWPRWAAGKGKSPPTVKGWEADECRRDLFAACAYKGTFDLEDKVRGLGAWIDVDGGLIYHAGDAIYIGGHWRAPGEIGKYIYPARPKLSRPAPTYAEEGPGSPGDATMELLRTFNWERGELDARLCLGWTMTAKVGGALRRRPVAFVVGQEGCGKSTLQELLRHLMNGAMVSTSNTTQAGIYQKVRQDSRAIFVDEMEAKEDTRTTDKILELARIAYSGDKMQRGGKDGVGKEFALMSSFMGSSIAKPATDAQDDSRMAVMMLRPLEGIAGKTPKQIDKRTIEQWAGDVNADSPIRAADLDKWGAQLMKRWFDWWPRWPGLLRVFRMALLTAGHTDRSADTFGPLAAGYHVAVRDTMPTPDEVREWLEWLKVDTLAETASKEDSWKRCFLHMLQAQPEVLKGRATKSLGDAIVKYRDNPLNTGFDLDEILSVNGLALSWQKDQVEAFDSARLFVPAKHPGVHALFEGTPWAGRLAAPGPWIGVLRQAPRHLWENGLCGKGLDKKAKGVFIRLAAALDA